MGVCLNPFTFASALETLVPPCAFLFFEPCARQFLHTCARSILEKPCATLCHLVPKPCATLCQNLVHTIFKNLVPEHSCTLVPGGPLRHKVCTRPRV